MKKYFVIVLACLASFAFVSPKFLDFPTEILSLLEKYYINYPIEKVYVQTDKNYYASGEKVWFKAVMRYEDTLFVDSLSKVLYVELLDAEHRLIEQRTLQIENNTAIGDISLSDSLVAGNYELRAYTSWLRNFGEENFFHKTLNIFRATNKRNIATHSQNNTSNSQNITSEKLTKLIDKPILQFYPEGGDMVKMLRNHVAFKATDSEGRGIFVEGIIQNEEGKTCANFKSNELGLGSFRITPLGTSLTAKIISANGDTLSYKLPTILEKGLILSVSQITTDSLKILLQSNLASFENGKENYCLFAQSAGKVVFMGKASLKKNVQTIFIKTQNIPTGVLQLSLIDENKIPHCERLVFINHNDGLNIDLKTNKTAYKPREKIQIDITTNLTNSQANINTQKAISSELSVLVIDNNLVKSQEHEENILTRFLLSSELKGKIENPAYYLQNTDEAKQNLDYLMMTQGFRRFKWRELLNETSLNLDYPVEQSLAISGVVVNSTNINKPVENANVSMLFNYDLRKPFMTYTNKEGKFTLSGLNFSDSVPILLTALGEKNGHYIQINLDKPKQVNSTYQSINSPNSFNKTDYMSAIFENKSFMKSFYFDKTVNVLEEVKVITKRTRVEPEYRENTNSLHSVPDVVIKEDAFQSLGRSNVLFALQGRVAGLVVGVNAGGGVDLRMRNGGIPLVLYDGLRVDASFFSLIPNSDIAAIEVLKGANALYGNPDGVIAVYSKKGSQRVNASNYPNKLQTKIKGFYTAQEFFSPNYDTLKMPNPDKRTTIYWKGRVKTDSLGKATVTFFAADLPTNYKIIVEGIAQKVHLLGRKEYEIVVGK